MRVFLLIGILLLLAAPVAAQAPGDNVRLAYVKDNNITLADYEGNPLTATGPQLGQWEAARLFWSPNGETLYVATRNGLFVTSGQGGAAVRLPGEFGLTVAIARHGGVLYNLDTDNPQPINDTTAAFPIRETNLANAEGGRGRLMSTIGTYEIGAANINTTGAAALYALDGGLLEGGRPQFYATFGGSLFYSCCFPNAGLGVFELGSGNLSIYDNSFLTGPAAMNATMSRLAGPTTDGIIRTIDLISGGQRDYVIDVPGGVGFIERMAWSLDDSALFFVSREAPGFPLELSPTITFVADTRSANAVIWKLDLVTGNTSPLAEINDVFGISSMAASNDYLFATAIAPNDGLVNALNTGALDPNIQPGDPALDAYIPRSTLWRIDQTTGQSFAIDENIWGVTARPN
jgi:hypothetical protein